MDIVLNDDLELEWQRRLDTLPTAPWVIYNPDTGTTDIINLPRGEHKVRIEAVDAEGRRFIARTVTFTVPGPASSSR